jgi:hypothetical protein
MNLLTKFTAYQSHLSGQLAEAEIDEHAAESMLEVEKARHLAKGWTGESTSRVAVQKANATMDPKIRQLSDELDVIKARRKLLGIMVDTQSRGASVVSREISRRIGREGHERRVDRFNP